MTDIPWEHSDEDSVNGSDNYQSPYGFGPLTDAVFDVVADRRGIKYGTLATAMERLSEEVTEELDGRINNEWWEAHMGPTIDALEDLLSEYIPIEAMTPLPHMEFIREAMRKYRITIPEGYERESFDRSTPYTQHQKLLEAGRINQAQFDFAAKFYGDRWFYTGD